MMLCSGVGSWESSSLLNNYNCLWAIQTVVNNRLAIEVVRFTDFLPHSLTHALNLQTPSVKTNRYKHLFGPTAIDLHMHVGLLVG